MATPGRAPQPSAIKRAKGNPGKRPLNVQEPKPKIEAPKPPKHLSRYAKREWRRIVPLLLNLGILSQLDRSALAIYCQAYGRWKKAEREMKEDGEVILTKHGQSYQSPWLSISNKAVDQMSKSLAEFGLSPSSRTRIVGTAATDEFETDKEKAVRDILDQMDRAGAKFRTGGKA